MAYRTDADRVKGLIPEVDNDLFPSLDPFILSANELVTEICVPVGYSDVRLELIERWLAAHFAAVADPPVTDNQIGPLTESRPTKIDLHFDETRFGQQAILLDTAGGLAALQAAAGNTTPPVPPIERVTAQILYLGTSNPLPPYQWP